ncbi:hypothetical protein [Mesorhizobium sp. ANAO-SY3R2]|uniref:hypothetical protein n=1 Tax=Mesorhizobium sp. ANAO-SY3R2 TaxID=3166644 RepID=UPI0036714BB4
MKKLILASVSAVALFGIAACNENKDKTTTQSVKPPASEQSTTVKPEASPSATDKMTTQGVDKAPETGDRVHKGEPMQPKPAEPAQ